ncbi:AsmA family protein [Devosia beringensis]|uniref:AsmA family protein n=1 Tax=Devosia beringensis TaxID=2657486 RepID=UPI00186B600A|nr:AsmA family protein [Devosia beringensis]
MLNRIYIVVGLLAIIVLGGAFVAPYLIQWGDYRSRMEALASQALGTPVTIRGDIAFALLPQPRLNFSDVLVGSPEEPAATVDSVDAEFSLMDFLRDNYDVTKLVLSGPVIDFSIDESGLFGSGVSLAGAGGGVALGQASIVDGTIRLLDRRVGQTMQATKVEGELKLSSFSGPFQLQGSAEYQGARYGLRVNAAALDAAGSMQLSSFVQAEGGAFSLAAEGLFTPGIAPKFDGTMTYRQTPPVAARADDIRGDLVLESKLVASTDRIVLSGYTLQPDQNRAGTRLTGAASIQLGARRSFDAVVSGGVFSLPPRDAKEDATALPYEAVRLLTELPAPLIPPLPGRIGIDLAEVGLRGFALRDVRLDASSDGQSWTVEQFLAQLPGDTGVQASGQLDREGDQPAFRGTFAINSGRLDGLAQLWRKPEDDTALFNQGGTLAGNVMLTGDALRVSEAQLTLAEAPHAVELRIGFGAEQRLDVVGHFADLGRQGSAVLGALLPDWVAEPRFGISFPEGSFSLTGQAARVLGQDGTALVAEGQWTQNAISFSRLSAGDWGGLGFDAAFTASGNLVAPRLAGSGRIAVSAATAPALAGLYDLLGTPPAWRDFMARSAPAEVLVDLEPGDGDGQILTLGGKLGVARLDLRAELDGGISALRTAPLQLTATLEAEDSAALGEQIGLGQAALFDSDDMMVSLRLDGTPSNSLDSRINISAGEEYLGFAGFLVSTDAGEVQGTGSLDMALGDAGGLARIIGAPGISLPEASGSALLHFEGDRLARLSEIEGKSGEAGFSGTLGLTRTRDGGVVAGDIAVDTASVEGLAVTLFGRAAMVGGDGGWPEGPISIGEQARTVRGSVAVTAGGVTAGGNERLGVTSFELVWDETRLRLARFEAVLGAGTASLDLAVCCAGPLADKTVSGRLSLSGAAIAGIAPPALAEALTGVLEGGVQVDGTGASIAEVLGALAGEGNFTVTDFAASQLSPQVFPALAGLSDVLNMDGDALRTIIAQSLEQGPFAAPSAAGAFTIAGGVLRLTNFLVDGAGARLAGDLTLGLESLGLGGEFALTPNGFEDAGGLIGADTARIFSRIGGTLLAPMAQLDLDEMVAAIQVRANELEVDRLEALRAADAERQRAAAEERNRLIAEQRRRAAEEAAARAAAEEAARLAEEAAAQQALEAPPPASEPAQANPAPSGPLYLGLPPPQLPPSTGLPGT